MEIQTLTQQHAAAVLAMMRDFYSSPAVSTGGSDEIFRRDIDACLSAGSLLHGYIFSENGTVAGYAMVASAYSTEFGAPCLLVEDVYIRPEFRAKGYGRQFFEFLVQEHPDTVLRLEVTPKNEHAMSLYTRAGFEALPYVPMVRAPHP